MQATGIKRSHSWVSHTATVPEYLKLDNTRTGRGWGPRVLLGVLGVVLVLVVLIVVQLARGTAPIKASVVIPNAVTVPGTPPALPWPKYATAAVAIEGVGTLGGVRTEVSRSLASVAKLFTALVVLKQHPLTLGQSGPSIPITSADATKYQIDVRDRDSVVKVTAGEHLTELQALEGMLIPSADNLARLLANWSDTSHSAFVQAMNGEAAALGLTHTHLAGPSGLNPASVSTATDLVKVGEAVMANPVLRQIVGMPQVTLPVAGTVFNVNDMLGRDGIIGIKTGSTPAAGGNFVFAASHHVQGRNVTVIGAILGATGVQALQNALDLGAKLADAAAKAVREVSPVSAGEAVVRLHAPWGPTVVGRTGGAAPILAVPGEQVSAHVVLEPAVADGKLHQIKAGQRLGTLDLQVRGHTTSLPITASGSISAPSLSYKLERF